MIDPIVPRYTALLKDELVTVNIKGAEEGSKTVPKHPKVSDISVYTNGIMWNKL